MLLFLGLVALAVGGAAVLSTRPVTPAAQPLPAKPPPRRLTGEEPPGVSSAPPPAAVPVASFVPPVLVPLGTVAPPVQPPALDVLGGVKGLAKLGGAGAGAAVGVGAVIGTAASVGAQDTKEVKEQSAGIGAGVALAAYFANVGGVASATTLAGTLSALSLIAVPLLVVTYSIVVVADQVLRFGKMLQWQEMVRQVAKYRRTGKFAEALALYRRVAPSIELASRRLPESTDAWWVELGGFGLLGEPWPGGASVPPPPATWAEVKKWPETVPATVPTEGGRELDVRRLLDAAYGDAVAVRTYLLTTPAVGRVAYPAGPLGWKPANTGPRDLRAVSPYKEARELADAWARKLTGAFEWVSTDALVRNISDQAEDAVDAAVHNAAAAAAVAAARTAATRGAKSGGTEQTSTAAERRTSGNQNPADESKPTGSTAGRSTGRPAPTGGTRA